MKRIIAFVFCFIFSLFLISCEKTEDAVSIHVIDIGKADCIVIETGGKNIMIDTGERSDVFDITRYLSDRGIEKIDLLILTHFDKDHIGGASELILKYDVDTVIENSFYCDRDEYREYHDLIEERGILNKILTEDYSFKLGACSFTVYPPKKSSYNKKEDNNSSLIVSMEHGEGRVLFCGDAMEERLNEFIEETPLRFDFVKLPYHGNYLKNYDEFIKETSPSFCVITCSKKNPADDRTIELLSRYNIEVLQTVNGSVQVTSDGKNITVSQ